MVSSLTHRKPKGLLQLVEDNTIAFQLVLIGNKAFLKGDGVFLIEVKVFLIRNRAIPKGEIIFLIRIGANPIKNALILIRNDPIPIRKTIIPMGKLFSL
jgi:hypothetical protein